MAAAARRAGLVVGGLAAGLLAAELVVRGLGLAPEVYQAPSVDPQGFSPFETLPQGPMVYRRGARFAFVYDPRGDEREYLGPTGRIDYSINDLGLRGPEVELLAEGDLRVICLGDSITFGEGLRYEDTYPARLDALLAGDGSDRAVQVLNAGVQAYGTPESWILFRSRLAQLEPDVVVLGFFLNDASDFGETIQQHLERSADLELTGLARWSKLWETLQRERRGRQQMEEYFETTRAGFRSPRWQDCQRALKALVRAGDQQGFRFLVVIFPMLYGLEGDYPFEELHAEIVAACRAAGCESIDLLEDLRGMPSRDLWVHPTDQHPNEIVHEIAAQRIAERLQEGGSGGG